jgi:Type I restriction enzyme R protein N terminus (HSDR_N)
MPVEKNNHHLSLGELEDFITGDTIADTHDERFRQKIAKLLVKESGFDKAQIKKNVVQIVEAGNKKASIKIDFLVELDGKITMLVKYNPGSIITRRQSCIALSRIAAPYQIPMAVMTNGREAEIIDPVNKQVIRTGIDALPDVEELKEIMSRHSFHPLPDEMIDMASRIVYAFEIDGSCPCDSDVCEL